MVKGTNYERQSHLEFVLEEILLVWHFAIKTQQTLLIWTKGLWSSNNGQIPCLFLDSFWGWPTAKTHTDVNLVLLMRIHCGRQEQDRTVFAEGEKKKKASEWSEDKAIKPVAVVAVVKVLWTGANDREAGKRATVGRQRSLPDEEVEKGGLKNLESRTDTIKPGNSRRE